MKVVFDGVSVRLDGHLVLDGLSVAAESGQILGIVGPNGSGKSTALRCLYRAIRPTTGVIRVGDHQISRHSLRASARSVGALAQDGASDLDFTVRELVQLGRTPHLRGNAALSDHDHEICWRAMEQMDVAALADRGVLSLSGGERQRVLVARALAQEPQVVVLDEPTNHLDLRHQVGLLSHLRATGLTIVIVLHDLNLAAALCDRLAVLDEGTLVAVGPPADVLTRDLIRSVFGVDAHVVSHPLTGDPQLIYSLDPISDGSSERPSSCHVSAQNSDAQPSLSR